MRKIHEANSSSGEWLAMFELLRVMKDALRGKRLLMRCSSKLILDVFLAACAEWTDV
jgi:hypothetical protein